MRGSVVSSTGMSSNGPLEEGTRSREAASSGRPAESSKQPSRDSPFPGRTPGLPPVGPRHFSRTVPGSAACRGTDGETRGCTG